uniref:Late blight resistance protein n=1 Tax=Solanum tuberosum TaxID=4113 RepID=M1DM12_SOLTU
MHYLENEYIFKNGEYYLYTGSDWDNDDLGGERLLTQLRLEQQTKKFEWRDSEILEKGTCGFDIGDARVWVWMRFSGLQRDLLAGFRSSREEEECDGQGWGRLVWASADGILVSGFVLELLCDCMFRNWKFTLGLGERRKEEKEEERARFVKIDPLSCCFRQGFIPTSIMMQTQVTRIGIQRIVDPVSSSESVGEPLCILEDPVYLLSSLSDVRMIGGPVPTSLLVLEAS